MAMHLTAAVCHQPQDASLPLQRNADSQRVRPTGSRRSDRRDALRSRIVQGGDLAARSVAVAVGVLVRCQT